MEQAKLAPVLLTCSEKAVPSPMKVSTPTPLGRATVAASGPGAGAARGAAGLPSPAGAGARTGAAPADWLPSAEGASATPGELFVRAGPWEG